MREIPLTKGKVALVSDEDYEWLMKWKWIASKAYNNWYAKRWDYKNGKQQIKMHREILGVTDPSVLVDHKDSDGLNNQRDNLRTATHSQNSFNRPSNRGSTSIYKGVSASDKGFHVEIRANNTRHYIGTFQDEAEAARHYNAWAVKLHGEYAVLNPVDPLFPSGPKSSLTKRNTSGYLGIFWIKNRKKWMAAIRHNYKLLQIGFYDDPIEAAKIRDAKALELLGPRARLNFPELAQQTPP